jgi:hypothetical protein
VASYYVYSGAAGAGTGANWANAFTTLTAAFSGKAAGDIFYVAHNHAESTAGAVTLTSPGSITSPCFVYCVNSAGSVPPVSADLRTTATVATTGANTLTFGNQTTYFYGLTFTGSNGANSQGISAATTQSLFFEACALRKGGTASGGSTSLFFSNGNGVYRFKNTTFQFGNTNDGLTFGGNVLWQDTASAITGATIPTSMIELAPGVVVIEGVDLSALGSGTTLFRADTEKNATLLKDCKLGASVTIAATPTAPLARRDLIRCDSGDTNYRTERYDYTGTLTTETTIVRTGGASDGTTPISWKVITTANSERIYPFEVFPISIWNETTGSSVTVTVECRGAATPNIDEVWMDVEYLGTSGFPQGNFATSGHADLLATGTACTSSSESWGGSTSSFKLVKAITPQEKGPITVYVKIAKVSSTFYIDPKITLS